MALLWSCLSTLFLFLGFFLLSVFSSLLILLQSLAMYFLANSRPALVGLLNATQSLENTQPKTMFDRATSNNLVAIPVFLCEAWTHIWWTPMYDEDTFVDVIVFAAWMLVLRYLLVFRGGVFLFHLRTNGLSDRRIQLLPTPLCSLLVLGNNW